MPSERTFVPQALLMMKLMGGNPQRSTVQNILLFLTILGIGSAVFLNFYQLVVFDITIDLVFAVLDSAFILLQGFVRAIRLFLTHKDLKKLLEDRKTFRRVTELKNQKLQDECYDRLAFAYNFCVVYTLFSMLVVLVVLVDPLLSPDEKLVFSSYVPKFMSYKYMVIYQSLVFIQLIIFASGHDFLLCTLLMVMPVYFKSLRDMIFSFDLHQVDLDEEKTYTELKKIVGYHNNVMDFLKRINKVFSPLLLYHLMNVIVQICTDLYVIKITKSPATAVIMIGIFIQFTLFFCLPSQIISNEGEKLIETVYNLKWHQQKSPRIRRAILFMIMRCQKPMQVSAGNFVINLETCLATLKFAGSVYMCISTVQTEV